MDIPIYNKLEERTGNSHFNFRCALGTREALFDVQVLIKKCRDVSHNFFLRSTDFEKDFDKVHYEKMLQILK